MKNEMPRGKHWTGNKKIPTKFLTGPRIDDGLPKSLTRTDKQAHDATLKEKRRRKHQRERIIANCPGHQYEPYQLYRCPEVLLYQCDLCKHVKFENGTDAMEFHAEYNRRINNAHTIQRHVNMNDMLDLEQQMAIKNKGIRHEI